ncbi:adenylate/guanylate cyclase domain-containing protein [Amorphus sp. 3PC139-8]|uniref:adenylate/guanylate cyclase domain-containing protein n=1 Tax=Amorphus sp. 3PC139-8 TaxID=2735676 RepID=UPI00345CF2B7
MRATQQLENGYLKEAFSREDYAGLRFAFRLRLVTLLAIAAWLIYSIHDVRVLYYLGLIALFIILGGAPLLLRNYGRWGTGAIAIVALLDAALLTYALLAPNPLYETTWPLQMTLRFHNFLYFFVFLAGAAFSYSPMQVLWNGVAAAAMWSVGVYAIWSRPDTITDVGHGLTDPEGFLSPYFVNVVQWQNEVVLMLIVAGLLATAVWRSRRLVLRQIATEQARSNLVRYFSPNLVDQLASADRPFDIPRAQNAAVLFVDIVDFTAMAETMEPERAFALLRNFHQRMCRIVFAHHGTIDKYIGDAVLATFGTPQPGPTDATNALLCAHDMLREIERWNVKRTARGATLIKIGIGVHYGPVVAGNIGDTRRLEFTVIGDVVNVASRIERLTRRYDVPLIASGNLIDAVHHEGRCAPELLTAFTESQNSEVRGRRCPVSIWVWNDREHGREDTRNASLWTDPPIASSQRSAELQS